MWPVVPCGSSRPPTIVNTTPIAPPSCASARICSGSITPPSPIQARSVSYTALATAPLTTPSAASSAPSDKNDLSSVAPVSTMPPAQERLSLLAIFLSVLGRSRVASLPALDHIMSIAPSSIAPLIAPSSSMALLVCSTLAPAAVACSAACPICGSALLSSRAVVPISLAALPAPPVAADTTMSVAICSTDFIAPASSCWNVFQPSLSKLPS